MRCLVKKFVSAETGAVAIEYALIAGFISILLAPVCIAIGVEVIEIFTDAENGFKDRPRN